MQERGMVQEKEISKTRLRLYMDALRLERWPRSLAIIPGFIAFFVLNPEAFKEMNAPQLAAKLLGAFILTLLISTANYIVNEISDAPYDAFHPSKKHRPLVNKKISVGILMTLWLVMVLISLVAAYLFYENLYFLLALVALLVAGILYNVPPIRMKDIPYLDSTLESGNNPIRFLIGWHIIGATTPPASLLISWWAFGNFLMVGKRVAEKKFLTEEESAGYRSSLKRYSLTGLKVFMVANAVIFMATFCLFAIEAQLNSFLFSIPFVLVYLVMFMKKSLQDIEGAEEPERLLKNPYFAFYTLFLVAIFILAYIFK
ncbi:MAG: UbiA family prenyltransferase [Candidatus Aminicenantes bacterium]|nr:MAG: UbiA family prenyltransferase [Candidatus Aminicenantes bacterium]